MNRSVYLLLAAIAVLVTIGVWVLVGRGEDRRQPETSTPSSEPRSMESAPAPALDKVAGDRAAAADDRSAPFPEASEEIAETGGALGGRVVDSGNRPVAGAQVTAVRGVLSGTDLFDPEATKDEREVARAGCDQDGSFEMRVSAGRPHDLRASAPGFATTVVPDVYSGQTATIVLQRGAILSGVVRRKEGGAPGADARLILFRDVGRPPEWEGRTDASGKYLAENLRSGALQLFVFPAQQSRRIIALQLSEGETRTLDISLAPGAIVTGEVKDAQTGAPIAGAEVSTLDFLNEVAQTDDAGRYQLLGVSLEDAELRVAARAQGYGRFEVQIPSAGGADGSVLRADFELVRGRVVKGRVVSRSGKPIADAYVAAIAGQMQDRISTRTGPDGRFRIADVRTDVGHHLLVRKDGFGTTMASRVATGATVEVDVGDVVLGRAASLAGFVATPGDDPIQDATVLLRPSPWNRMEEEPLLRQTKTDAQGTFRFSDLAAGNVTLDVSVEGIPSKGGWTVELAEGEAKRDFKIVLSEGRSIGGRVLDARGLGIEGAELTLSSPYATARSRADGSFQFHGLEVGTYEITAKLADEHGPPGDRHRLLPATASQVAAGATNVVLVLRP